MAFALLLAVGAEVRFGPTRPHTDSLGTIDGNPYLKTILTYHEVSNTSDVLVVGKDRHMIVPGLVVAIPHKALHSVEAANNSRRTFDLVAAIDHAAVRVEPPLLTRCAGRKYGLGGRSLTKAECRRAVDVLAVGEMVANLTGDGCHVWTNPYHTASRFTSVPADGTVEVTMCGRARRDTNSDGGCTHHADCGTKFCASPRNNTGWQARTCVSESECATRDELDNNNEGNLCGDDRCEGYFFRGYDSTGRAPLRSTCRNPLPRDWCFAMSGSVFASMPDDKLPADAGCYKTDSGIFYSDGCKLDSLNPNFLTSSEPPTGQVTVTELCPCQNHADCGSNERCATRFNMGPDARRACVPTQNCTTSRRATEGYLCGDFDCLVYLNRGLECGPKISPLRSACSQPVTRESCNAREGPIVSMPEYKVPADAGCYETGVGHFYSDGCMLNSFEIDQIETAESAAPEPTAICGEADAADDAAGNAWLIAAVAGAVAIAIVIALAKPRPSSGIKF